MNLDEVEKLIQLMQRYELSELQIQEGEFNFAARKGEKGGIVHHAPTVVHALPAASAAELPAAAQGAATPPAKNQKEITSPIVGTFYRAPAPDQPHFKEVGDHVNPDDVDCNVEAMKVMNEIKAGVGGKIVKILVENSSPVEYGQPLFLVEVG
jgi:acetyl-CoA carboxylase biotin carboxyl carrier protein